MLVGPTAPQPSFPALLLPSVLYSPLLSNCHPHHLVIGRVVSLPTLISDQSFSHLPLPVLVCVSAPIQPRLPTLVPSPSSTLTVHTSSTHPFIICTHPLPTCHSHSRFHYPHLPTCHLCLPSHLSLAPTPNHPSAYWVPSPHCFTCSSESDVNVHLLLGVAAAP
ncbi:hypothetical protein BDN70DRAFT_937594 [Pholiota conissans]|uniref:Uncharacterized protein n=1 Tax=Pholiota conissans TaxID=109636 RepID=A0A9P6CN90_9AGAR|nr:hypothetical protein BDN70DRAFT_937594 [Pholiota conissans]